jgi:hypothetical protein
MNAPLPSGELDVRGFSTRRPGGGNDVFPHRDGSP